MEKSKERNRCYSIRVQTNPAKYIYIYIRKKEEEERNATETRK
jgi:hypothetical protein